MEKEHMEIKKQLQSAINHNVQLENKILEQNKNFMLADL